MSICVQWWGVFWVQASWNSCWMLSPSWRHCGIWNTSCKYWIICVMCACGQRKHLNLFTNVFSHMLKKLVPETDTSHLFPETCTCVVNLVPVFFWYKLLARNWAQLYSSSDTVRHVTRTVKPDWLESCCWIKKLWCVKFFVQVSSASLSYQILERLSPALVIYDYKQLMLGLLVEHWIAILDVLCLISNYAFCYYFLLQNTSYFTRGSVRVRRTVVGLVRVSVQLIKTADFLRMCLIISYVCNISLI